MRIERIVVGIDFGALSVAGARWAAQVLAPHAEIVLAHVMPATPEAAASSSSAPSAPAARATIATRLEEVARLLPGGGERVRTEIRVGKAHTALAELADETGADIVVIGPHGEHPAAWRRLGTTADRLVRVARVPVLVAIGAPAHAPRRLLVALGDADDIAERVLGWARHLARAFDAEVTFVATGAPAYADAGAGAESPFDGARVSPVVADGSPGNAIAATARREGAELVVLGRPGARAALPEALGETIATVLQGVRCPVLVVIAPADAASERW